MSVDDLLAEIRRSLEGIDVETVTFEVQEVTEYVGVKDGEVRRVSLDQGTIQNESNWFDRMDKRTAIKVYAKVISTAEYVMGKPPESKATR